MAKQHTWRSTWLFILAATGSAVGLGNVWKFPYIAAENGGGAFILVYLACVAFVGAPVLLAEILIGKRGGISPTHCFKQTAIEAKASSKWQSLGLLGMLTSFLLLSYYAVIAGMATKYTFYGLLGNFSGNTAESVQIMYSNLQASPWQLLLWSTIFLSITAIVVSRGIKNGLETVIQYMVPLLFILLIILVARAFFYSNHFSNALVYMFIPRWQDMTTNGFLAALGHAFFTLSIATASMLIYGCYLKQQTKLVPITLSIVFLDTLSAILAGLAIYPIIFDYNLSFNAGPALVFKTLPLAFATMPVGNFVGSSFFLLLLFAALGSSISMLEPLVAWILGKWSISRPKATLLAIFPIWVLSVGSVLSFNIWQQQSLLFGVNFYTLIDNLVSLILLPLGGLLLSIYAGWIMPKYITSQEITKPILYKTWLLCTRYIAPIAIMLIMFI